MIQQQPTKKREALRQLCQDKDFQERLAEYRARLEAPHEPQKMTVRGQVTTCCEWNEAMNRRNNTSLPCPRTRQTRDLFRLMDRMVA